MTIWDVLESATYTGLCLAALSKEKLDEALEKIKKEKGYTEKEGRNFANKMKEQADAALGKFNEIVTGAVKKVLVEAKLAKSEELEDLKKRIVKLEKKLTKPGDDKKV